VSDEYAEQAAELLKGLTLEHRGWCNFCKGSAQICERTAGKSYECSLIGSRNTVAAELRKARRALHKAAGHKVYSCVCVFGEDDSPPLRVCNYHAEREAKLAEANKALAEVASLLPDVDVLKSSTPESAHAVRFITVTLSVEQALRLAAHKGEK